MTGISRRRWGPASWLRLGAAVLAVACGGRARTKNGVDPSAPRVVPLASVIVLETAGPVLMALDERDLGTFATKAVKAAELLHGAPRERAGDTAPAHGLCLASVAY